MTEIPVFLDVRSRLDVAAAQLAAREAVQIFRRAGDEIGSGLGSSLSRAFGVLDGSAARRELEALQAEYARTAEVEEAAARRMVSAMGQVEVAQKRLNELTDKYGADSSKAAAANVALADSHARASKAQRDHVDAMLATEGAAGRMSATTQTASDSVSRASQVFNAVGAASLAAYGAAIFETTKKAGDFQESQTRLVASAGESSANLKTVSDGILQMAGQVGYSAQEISKAMYGVEKAGFRGADAVTVMKSAAQGAKSENAELGEVLNGLTTSMNDFHFGADQSADVMSKMVAATSIARTNFQDFSGALHTAEPLFANIGKSQGLNAGQMQHLMADLYGVGAQMTRSGDSADHAFQLITHAEQKMLGPTAQMRDMMGALGLDAQDISDHLGERGLSGTMQLLDQALQKHTKDGKVNLDVHYQSAQLARAEAEAFNGLSPAAHQVAEEIKNGTLSYKEFRKSRGGLSVEQANEVSQWNALNNKLTGFSSLIKSGIGDQISLDQAMKILTGDQSTLQVMLQTTGENTDATNDKIKQIDQTTREHDGTVKGFNETQETLNAKMSDAKAAFGAAAIEIGSAFVPMMTSVANVAKDVGDEFAKHPALMHAVIDALGLMGTAWATFKAVNVIETLLGINRGLATMAAEEDAATAGAGRLAGALSGLAKFGGLAIGAQLGGNALQNATAGNSFLHGAAVVGTDAATGAALGAGVASIIPGVGTAVGGAVGGLIGGGLGLYNQLAGHAAGGALDAPGPKGRDSALFWGAKGEHVLTADDVDAMGGHGAVYAFRNALHRQVGGPIGNVNTGGMQLDTLAVAQAVSQMFPGVTIGGYRAPDGFNEHSSGEAADIMVGSNTSLGNSVASWALSNARQFGVEYVLWQQRQWNPDGTSSPMADRGSPTQNHMDHVHIRTAGGGYPAGGGPGAAGAGSMPSGTSSTPAPAVTQGFSVGGAGGFGGGMGGFGGGGGYYTQDPAKVAAAQERLTHLDAEIKTAEEKKAELKSDAKQSERDRLDEQIRHLHVERDQAQARLEKAEQGTFHAGRGAGGAGGISGFGVPLPANFGLNKGLGGVAEWLVDFLGDLALAPIEGAMYRAAGMGAGAGGFGSPGGYADLGDIGTPFTASAFASGSGLGAGFGNGGLPMGLGAPSTGTTADSSAPGPSAPQAATGAVAGASIPAPPAPAAPLPTFQPGPASISGGPLSSFAGIPVLPELIPRLQGMSVPRTTSTPAIQGLLNAATSHGGSAAIPDVPGLFGAPGAPANRQQLDLSNLLSGTNLGTPGRAPIPMPSRQMGPPSAPSSIAPTDIPGFSTGGPSGTDTIPAWLSPGEFVMNPDAVKQFGPALSFMNAHHFASGGPTSQTSEPAPPPAPGAPMGSSGPGSPGLGISGGAIGAAEGAAAAGADMFAPGSGMAVQVLSQLANRTVAYGGQMAGIAVQGILSTLIPSDSPLSDFGNTLPGKLLSGIAGAKPAAPISAGNTQPPLKQPKAGEKETAAGQQPGIGMQINGMTVQAPNAEQFKYTMEQQQQQHQMDRMSTPMIRPPR